MSGHDANEWVEDDSRAVDAPSHPKKRTKTSTPAFNKPSAKKKSTTRYKFFFLSQNKLKRYLESIGKK